MSAKECLNHEWIQSSKKLPKINITPVTPLPLTSMSAQISSFNKINSLQNSFNFTTAASTISLSIPSSPNSPQNIYENTHSSIPNKSNNEKFNAKLKDSLECLAHSLQMETVNQGLSPLKSSRENGLPPIRYMSNKTSNHSSTSSLSKGGSKQSLDRIRSISKSREILFERLQKSSQRKILSRSRERICDSRFGLYLSREKLMENRSISHSVETLPPSDLKQDDLNSFYSSSGNVCALPIFSMLPLVEENGINCRQYRSMAAINNIDGEYDNPVAEKIRKESVHSNFVSKGYADLLNKHEIVPKESSTILKSHNNDHLKMVNGKIRNDKNKIKQSNQKNSKTSKPLSIPFNKDKERIDNQKRKKDKEKNKVSKMKENNTITDIYNNNENKKVKNKNRGSGFNIEQRIQIRRSRKNNLKSESNIRSDKGEPLKKVVQDTNSNKPNNINKNIPHKNNLNSQKSKKNSTFDVPSTDISKPFGLSVNKPMVRFSPKIVLNKNLMSANNIQSVCNSAPTYCKISRNTKILVPPDKRIETDEAYISLEEPIEDSVYDRNKNFKEDSSKSNNTSESSDRIEKALQLLNLTDIGKTSVRNVLNGKLTDIKESGTNVDELKYENEMECNRGTKDLKGQDLTVIAEEEENSSITSYVRSVSTCSDLSSVLSEFSEDVIKSRRNSEIQEMKMRRRSLNVQRSPGVFVPDKLLRSKSLHLDSPLLRKTRPWGDLCSGSIDRAYSVLRQKSTDFIFVPRKNSDPTSNRPKTKVVEKNCRLSFKNRLVKV